MKNRDRQRINRKMKEEMLNRQDECGIDDPTPYEAVKEIIRKNKVQHHLYIHISKDKLGARNE